MSRYDGAPWDNPPSLSKWDYVFYSSVQILMILVMLGCMFTNFSWLSLLILFPIALVSWMLWQAVKCYLIVARQEQN